MAAKSQTNPSAAGPAPDPQELHQRHPYDVEGTEYLPETCAHVNPPLFCKECALIGVHALVTQFKQLEADLTALRARLAVPAWQPIESAPADALMILFAPDSADESDRVVIGTSHSDHGFVKFPHAWPVKPTHWMPLPPPPAAEGAR